MLDFNFDIVGGSGALPAESEILGSVEQHVHVVSFVRLLNPSNNHQSFVLIKIPTITTLHDR